jgi:hypothetical protein
MTTPVNLEKIDILKLYIPLISEKQIESLKMNPIMMGRKFLHEKIEQLYSKQFGSLLRQKKLEALDLSKVVRRELRNQFKNTPNYWVQSLANIIYSSHKFSDEHSEIAFFLRFLRSYKSPEFLFYLYIRQQFINICKISFINHFKSPKNFKNITISKAKAVDVLERTLRENKKALSEAKSAFHKKYKSAIRVQYYDFLIFCLDLDINHANLDTLDKIIEFYGKKPKLPNSPKKEIILSHQDTMEQKTISEHYEDINMDETIPTQMIEAQPNEVPRLSETQKKNTMITPDVIEQCYPTRSERGLQRKSEFPTRHLRQVFGKNLKEKEIIITDTIKVLLREEIQKMLDNYISTFEITGKQTKIISKSLFELILSKCKTVLTMIFFQNRKRFFNIIRKNPTKEKELVEAYEELANMYDYFKKYEVDTPPVLRQFVKKCLMFPTLQEEMLFLLRYMFKVD